MENDRLREVWRVWAAQYASIKDLTERLVAGDILELIGEVVTLKIENECLKNVTLDPDMVMKNLLKEIGIARRNFKEQ
jgi:hypothetical protein